MPRDSAQETWTRTERGLVHAYLSRPDGHRPADDPDLPDGTVVVVPGLGLPQYLRPLVDELTARGRTCAVLDLPGFAAPGPALASHGSTPHVDAVGAAAAGWVRAHRRGGSLTVVGHSTGAQGALGAALALQDEVDGLALVMAGPTFTPTQRRLGVLALATLTAYRHDSPRELVVAPTVARRATGVWALMRSGMRDVPEERVAELTVPLVLTAGDADTFAPEAWLQRLAECAGGPALVHLAHGSHNNPFTHPTEVADAVSAAEQLVRARR